MADLIDRQSVIDLLKKNVSGDIEELVISKNIRLIADMPKAYDVEKVVEKLENEAYNGFDITLSKATDIVKRGGING